MTPLKSPAGVYDPSRPEDVQPFIPGEGEVWHLPEGITKAAAITTISAGLRLMGASERVIAVWRYIADSTERVAWTGGSHAPLNWRRQCDMAREMGLSERQWRNIEAALVGFGVLARATAENGYRGHRAGSSYARPLRAGLSLAPALANYEAFVSRLAEADALEAQRQEHMMHARTARKRVGDLIAGLSDREVYRWARQELTALETALRPDVLRSAEASALTAWHSALLDLEDRLREACTPLPSSPAMGGTEEQETNAETEVNTPVDNAARKTEKQYKISAAPEIHSRSLIQPEYNFNSTCNDHGLAHDTSKRTPAKAGDEILKRSPPNGGDRCLEKSVRI